MAADGVRVHVESRGICHIASGRVRNDRDVIAYLFVLRETRLRIERIAHWEVSSPGRAAIRTPGVKQLRINVVRRVSCVIPDSVKPSIGRY